MKKIKEFLDKPVDIAPLVFFRIAFGLIMLWEVTRMLDKGKMNAILSTVIKFKYPGFSWVNLWPGDGLYYHLYIMGAAALFIAIGFLYRISTTIFFLGFTYYFLLDQTYYLNHFYLVCLISFIMIFIPAHKNFSVDTKFFPKIKTDWVPHWTLFWLIFQLSITYFFGGIAKINKDWLRGEPLRTWMSDKEDLFFIGKFVREEWFIYLMSYTGLLLDLFIVPLLLYKKTRWIAVVPLFIFHLSNAHIWNIGIFPWFMIAATALFFPPHQLRFFKKTPQLKTPTFKTSNFVLFGLGVYLTIQILFPLRHFLYEGNVAWNEEGHQFSWRMKLRGKRGNISIKVADFSTNSAYLVELETFLTPRQIKKMHSRPELLRQFAHYLSERTSKQLGNHAAVFVTSNVSLNSRPKAPFIDPKVDLSKEEFLWFKSADWILPYPYDQPSKTKK